MELFDLGKWKRGISAAVDQVVIDSRAIVSSNALFVALPGTNTDGHNFVSHAAEMGASHAIVSRDFPGAEGIDLIRVDNPLLALQEISSLYRNEMGAKVVAVTGSYGKTMVKDLLYKLLCGGDDVVASPESFNSQIGVPLSLLTLNKQDRLAIIEAGISTSGEMDILAKMIRPDCGILTNIGHAHLALMKNLSTTANEKIKMLKKVKDWVLLPYDELLLPYLSELPAKQYFWNKEHSELPHASSISGLNHYSVKFPDGMTFTSEVPYGYTYFLDLVNIAIKAAWLLKVSSHDICNGLADYFPEPMRVEIWRSPSGITYINDTYCADAISINQALDLLRNNASSGKKIFIFGGIRESSRDQSIAYRHIGKSIACSSIDLLMLSGKQDFSEVIAKVTTKAPKIKVCLCREHSEVFDQLHSYLDKDDTILIKGPTKERLEILDQSLPDYISNSRLVVNLAAIKHNIELLQNHIQPSPRIMVMVKAMAYGTDNIVIAKMLSQCNVDIFGVAYLEEAIALRRAGVTQDIFILNIAPYETPQLVKWDFEVAVDNQMTIDKLVETLKSTPKQIKVHLHVDTGMSRLGCRPEEALDLARQLAADENIIFEGIMTHLAAADDHLEDPFTMEQVNTLEKIVVALKSEGIAPRWCHAANSAAFTRLELPQFNMVRLGLAIYGLLPFTKMPLRPAISLSSRIVGINICHRGETISYGRTYTVEKDNTRIGVVSLGFFDGVHRSHSGQGYVIIKGKPAQMVGSVCMDYMMVDITKIPEANIGDDVLIFGEDEYGHNISAAAFATWGKSTIYELMTSIGPRIQRIFVYDEETKIPINYNE